MKKFSISLTLILFLLGLFFGTPGFSQKEKTHPAVASSFEAQAQEMMVQKAGQSGGYLQGLTFLSTLQAGGDRLIEKQYTDGSWGWPLDAPPTYGNILGPITMGLAQAYFITKDPDHLAGLSLAGGYLLTKTNNFSPSDGYLAAKLDQIFGGSIYRDHVNTNFYGPLASGTYNRNGLGTLYNTTAYVNLIRTNRSGAQANMAAWDIGMGLVGAASCGVTGTELTYWIDGTKAEINELNSAGWYDVIGLAGGLYGLAFVDEEFSPTAGSHAGAANLQALAVILASYQINNGGFAWNSAWVIEDDNNESIQETAYAILALSEVNRAGFYTNILGAANYIATVQNYFGGWANDQYYNEENNEVTGEALWGYTVAHTETTIETPTEVACGIYDVDITVQNFTDIGAISLALNFDPLVVGSPTVINLTSGLTSNFPSTGQVRVADFGGVITLNDNAVLFTLRFTLLPASSGATTAFTWSTVPGECEYAGPGGTPIYVSSFFDLFWQIPVRPVKNTNTGLEYCTIQAAIDATQTLDGHTITVAAGNYPENVIVDKALTLRGANSSKPCNCDFTRGPESIISGSANVAVIVASDGVTIDGFKITNPGGNFGIYAGGRNDLTVMDNIITGVGNTVQSAASYGVAVEMSSTADITDVIITDNCISDINGGYDPLLTGTPAKLNNGSAGGIGVGWSTANYDITYLLIENNLISDIDAFYGADFANGGKGAYGVIINVGAGSSYIGTAINPEVQYNTISDLEGLWAHGIGLEGETPGASVHNNDISYLTDHKTPSDATGVMVEDNAGAASVEIHDNSFTSMSNAILNTMTGSFVDATCNWYGTLVATQIAGKIYGDVNYINWLVNGVDQQDPVCLPGFLPLAGSCTGSPVVIVSAVPTDNTCSTAGSIVVTWTGGVANYTVAWSPGSSASGISGNSYTITPLAAGPYNITVTDFYGNSAATSATVLYLPVTNVTDDPDTYYATIQAAINAADPNEEIDVCAGIYPENLLVNKAGLAIHGANFGISAGYTPGVRGPESVIVGQADVSANGVSFDGLEFDSPVAATTILVKPTLPGLSILFQNNVFDMKNQKSAAIYNDGMSSTNFTILNNKFKNQFYTGTYSARVIYAKNTLCTITGNDFSNVELGVYLIGTATDATIVSANRFNVTSAAVLTGERQNIQIINNDFVSGGAIYCDKTSNLTITNNWFGTGVTYAGYFIASIGSGIEMHNNSILSAYTSGANIGKTVFNFSTTQTVNATCNWWGTTVAANIAAKILGPVTYSPWLTTGGDDAGIIGFQPTGLCDGSLMGITAVVTDESCPCSYTGAINISVTPISGTYTYLWSPGGETTEDLTGLTGGTYTVVVTDTWTNTATLTVIVGTTPDVTPPVIACPANVTVNDMCSGPVTWMPDVTFFQNYGTNAYSACQHLWQSFTATTTGVLTQVDLYPYSGSNTGPWNVTIYDGEGEAGCVLYNNPSFTPTGSPIIFPIPRNVGVYVVYGQKYTISIVGPCNAATCDVCVDLYVRYDGGAVVYTGGKYFDNMSMGNPPASCNPPTTVTFPDGLPTDKAALGATYHIDQMASPFVATDNCKVKYVTLSPENGSTFTCGTTPVIATATDFAGLTDNCTFDVVVNAPILTIACPTDPNLAACSTAADILTAYNLWVAGFQTTGGCNVTTNIASLPVLPDLTCGGLLSFTYTVNSSCAPGTLSCSSTFTVAAPAPVVLTCPITAYEAACQTQAAINGKFATWLGTVVASGGCNGSLSIDPVTPLAPLACGGSTTVTWTYTSSCAPLTSTCSATFNVAAPAPPTIICPPPVTAHMNTGCTATGVVLGTPVTTGCNVTVVPKIGGITIDPLTYVFTGGNTTVTWVVTDGCSQIASCDQVVTVVSNVFSGTLNYYKQTPSFAPYPEQNMVVTLNSTTLVPSYNASFTTLGDGKYTFSGLCADTYTITVTTAKTAGGINSTDAAQVNAWGVAGPIYPAIEKVKFFSGDVLGSIPPPPSGPDNWITSGDAGRILQYFIQAGTPAFNTYKWKFWWAGETTTTNPTVATPISVAVAADVSKDLYGLCTGDWNGSYTLGKAGTESLTLEYGKTMQVSPGSEFELPLYAGMDMEVGAVSLIMNFPSADIEITGVFLSSDPSSPLLYNVSGDELRIGWNTLAPVWLNEGESLITLKMKVNEAAGNGSIYFSLAGDPLNELADGDYEVIGNAELTIDVVKASALGFGENSLAENLTLSNHPNPFNGTTTFVYSIPVDGKVILEIYDLLGNKVKVAVDETQSAGTYSLKLDANQLQPGVYTATIKLKNTDTAITRTIKIISK